MKFTHSAFAILVSSATAHNLFRTPRPFLNEDLIPRQLSSGPTSTASFPSFSIPSGTGFGGTSPTGTSPYHSHGTGRPTATHHSAGGGRQTRSRRFPRQFPSVTASTFGSSPTSLSPFNGTASAPPSAPPAGFPSFSDFPTGSETGFPTARPPRNSGSRHPHPTQTGPFPSGTGSPPFSFPTGAFPFPSGTGTAPFPFPTGSALGFGSPSAAPSTFTTSVLSFGG
jgi:hypothetical protein